MVFILEIKCPVIPEGFLRMIIFFCGRSAEYKRYVGLDMPLFACQISAEPGSSTPNSFPRLLERYSQSCSNRTGERTGVKPGGADIFISSVEFTKWLCSHMQQWTVNEERFFA